MSLLSRHARLGSRQTALALACGCALWSVALAPSAGAQGHQQPGSGSSGGSGQVLFVDGESRGGQCSDARSAAEVTALTPLCSLGRAVELSAGGTTVLVRGGSYPKLFVRDRKNTGLVTLKRYGSEEVVVNGFDFAYSEGFRIEGFRITDYVALLYESKSMQVVGNDISPRGVFLRERSSDILIEDNYIHDIARDPGCQSGSPDGSALWFTGNRDRIDNITIRGNRIRGVPIDAMQIGAAFNVLIEDNDIGEIEVKCPRRPERDGDHGDAIQTLGGAGYTIRRNYIHDMGVEGILLQETDDVAIENNVLTRILGHATQFNTRCERVRVVNNTWWENGYSGLRVSLAEGMPSGDTVVMNNIIDRFLVSDTAALSFEGRNLIPPGWGYRSHEDFTGTPSFVDPGGGDFRPASGSLGIDAAYSDGAPLMDRKGRPRSDDPTTPNQGAGAVPFYDIGAEEHHP